MRWKASGTSLTIRYDALIETALAGILQTLDVNFQHLARGSNDLDMRTF